MDLEGVIISEIIQVEKENTVYMESKKTSNKQTEYKQTHKGGHEISEGD